MGSSIGSDLSRDTLANTSVEELKRLILARVEGRDGNKIADKVRLVNEELMPLFEALRDRNPTPDLRDQVDLVQGVWWCAWSTIPFQDILPGRSHKQSYQIFDDNGYYANLARYQFSQKIPILRRFAKGLLNYDFMIIQSYAIAEGPENSNRQSWDIENVGLRQRFRLKALPFSPSAAQSWFNRQLAKYLKKQSSSSAPAEPAIPTRGLERSTTKRYEQIYQSKPTLEHWYIDRDFRLVKSRREANQRPSYTIATRLI